MTWLVTTRILYSGIFQCRSPQCRDLPSVVMSNLLMLVIVELQQWCHDNTSSKQWTSWHHQQQPMDIMTSPAATNGHHALIWCDVTEMFSVSNNLHIYLHVVWLLWNKQCVWLQMTISPFYSVQLQVMR